MTMKIMEAYDEDQQIPFLGFGAKLPPFYNVSSSCFAVNGDIFKPEASGVNGLMTAYKEGSLNIRPHGPSLLNEVIRFANTFTGRE